MKKILNFIVLALVFALFTVSCELERFPHTDIEQTQAFRNITDARNFNNGLYSFLRGRVYGIPMFVTDVQADQFNATFDFGNRNGSPHRWEDFLAGNYEIRDIWRNYYSAIANVNNFLDNADKVVTQSAAEEAELIRFVGEAHLIRAFYYHQLVIRWGKPYSTATSGSDLGVPLVLTYDVTLRPARATVQAVYTQILDDITVAKGLLPTAAASNPQRAEKFTHDAALALEARVRLHMQDWPGVINAANPLITSGRYPLITSGAGLTQMWENDLGTETIVQLFASSPSELGASNWIYLGFNPSTNRYAPDFVPQQWVVDMYPVNDIRKDVFLEVKPMTIQGAPYEGVYAFNKYPGNPTLFTTASTNYQHKPKVFRIAETYLNLAEAQYYVNESDARITINALRTARGLTALGGDVAGQNLLNEIRAERTRELLGEGFRLNDLMRWGMGVVRQPPQNAELVLSGSTYVDLNIPAGHDKFIWGIPTNDLTTNPSMVQNPGW